jgi:histidinol-phosphate aminotransferase
MSISRRDLIRIGGATAAGLALAGSGIRLASAERVNPDYRADLSGNENPYGPAPAVERALREAVDTTNRYGYARQKALAAQIAAYEGVTVEHIVLGAGSTEVLNASALAYTGSDKHVLTADQTYGAIPRYVSGIGREVVTVPLDSELRFDLDALHDRADNQTGLVYICNPNNPTGTVVDSNKLRDFCTSLPGQATVLVDEAYLEFTDDFANDSMVDLVRKDHNVIICRTFSKIHGLAGMRMGYSIAMPEISRRINSHKQCMFMGPLGSVAASVSLEQTEFHSFCRARAKEGRQLVFDLCDELGFEYGRGAGNFVFFNPGIPHDYFGASMRARGVDTARPFPPRRDWARVTMGTTEEMQIFAEVLREVVAG